MNEKFTPTPITLTTLEVVKYVEKFTPIVKEWFKYLNQEICPRIRCTLFVDIYDPLIYAGYKKPNIIIAYLGSIINNFMKDGEEVIRGVTVLTIAHELFHANQSTSMIQYGMDPTYANNIEQQAEYMAEQFLLERELFCQNVFGFSPKKIFTTLMEAPTTPYRQFHLKEFYVNTLSDVLYRNSRSKELLDEAFDVVDTIYLAFDSKSHYDCMDIDRMIIKLNGKYIESTVQYFAFVITSKYRMGNCIMNYTVSCKVEYLSEDSAVFHFTTSNHNYSPVQFPKIKIY